MKTIALDKEVVDLPNLLRLARQEPVLLITADGEEFFLAEADNFEHEVEQLRSSASFQRFLDERAAGMDTLSLDFLEHLLDAEFDDKGLGFLDVAELQAVAALHEAQAEYKTGK